VGIWKTSGAGQQSFLRWPPRFFFFLFLKRTWILRCGDILFAGFFVLGSGFGIVQFARRAGRGGMQTGGPFLTQVFNMGLSLNRIAPGSYFWDGLCPNCTGHLTHLSGRRFKSKSPRAERHRHKFARPRFQLLASSSSFLESRSVHEFALGRAGNNQQSRWIAGTSNSVGGIIKPKQKNSSG